MNIMDKTTAKISLHIDGMTWEQVREMIEERYGALMWDHKSTAYPTDSVVVRMAFAEPAGNVAQRAIGKAAPQQEVVAWMRDWDVYDPSNSGPEFSHTKKKKSEGWVPLYTVPQPLPASQGDALDAEQHEMDAKHAAIYRWMMSHVADVLSIFDNWSTDEEADTDELHDALAARAAQEGKSHG